MRIRWNHFALFLLVLLLLAGCTSPPPFPTRVLWPPPPARPYMELKNVYYSQDQLPKSGVQVFIQGIVGTGELATFKRPFGVAGDNQGVVYISDPGDSNIRVYDFNKNTVEYYSDKSIGNPYGLAVDQQGQLYVVDPTLPGVLVFGADRKPLRTIGSKAELTRPVYIALDEGRNRLYLSDSQAHKVVVYNLDGEYLFSFGKAGDEEGAFQSVYGLAIDRAGQIYVVDGLGAAVLVFAMDGTYLRRFGERGDDVSQLEQPRGLAFDSEGHIYICDARKGTVLTYSPEGTFLLATGMGRATHIAAGFGVPTSIWIDKNDQIFITDTLLARLSHWQYVSDAYLAAHPVSDEEQRAIQALQEKVGKPTP